MRFPAHIPSNVVVGILIFFGLLLGGYFVGRGQAAPSTSPTYITDSSGSNAATVNSQGHISVHIADPSLPSYRGPYSPRRIEFPARSLSHGQCYMAFADGPGDFLTATFRDHPGTGNGPASVLVRLDRSVVWLENGGSGPDAPIGSLDGVTAIPNGYVFAFPYTLFYHALAGLDVCWHGTGRSDTFNVELRVAGEGGADVSPEQMLFGIHKQGPNTQVTWTLIEGGAPVGYEVYGTNSTQVTFYTQLSLVSAAAPVKEVLSAQDKATHLPIDTYSATITGPLQYKRLYLFKMWPNGDPTRIGPFGSWSGE